MLSSIDNPSFLNDALIAVSCREQGITLVTKDGDFKRLSLTGTPPGVGLGQKPPIFLRAGQQVRAGVRRLGEHHQRVVE